jgi:hypothetical protein
MSVDASQTTLMRQSIRDGIARAAGVIGLAGMALIHTIDAPSHFVGGPDTYLGLMYVALIVASLGLAGGLIVSGDRRLWAASGALALSVIVGFVLSRTSGLPGDPGDVGSWSEPLGMASLFVEGTLMMLSGVAFALTSAATRGPSLGDMPRVSPRPGWVS